MVFSEIILKRIDKTVGELCRELSPTEFSDQVWYHYKIHQNMITLFECRPHWKDKTLITEKGVAMIKYIGSKNIWQLYWQRANMKWSLYEPAQHCTNIEDIVRELRADADHCFFG